MQIHVVQRGDTLWALSSQYGVSVNRIVNVNGLESPGQLLIGQALLIPSPYPRYVVQPGNTLGQIARAYETTVAAIMQANQLTNPSLIYSGQSLIIPVLLHTVRSGETLWSIAATYGTTIQALIQSNRITNPSLLYVGQVLQIPEPSNPTIEVNAFMTAYGQTGAQALRGVAYDLTYVSPWAYGVQTDGSLVSVDDTATIQTAQSSGVLPMMSIVNFSSTDAGTTLAHTILNSSQLQGALMTNVINTMKTKGYKGLNIDFENVDPSDKEPYNQFIQLVAKQLHSEGFFVSSSLAPKISADQPGLLYEAHDYPVHGQFMDFVVLMTYEWGYRLGPPQAISPANQIQAVLDYAVTAIPRNKIMMGFEVYARDWVLPHVQGQQAETFNEQEAIRRAIQYNAVIQYDQTAQSPYYNYTDAQGTAHQVWFEDPRSTQAKFNLVKSYNLRGISYWVLEYPFPQNWSLLADTFTISRLSP